MPGYQNESTAIGNWKWNGGLEYGSSKWTPRVRVCVPIRGEQPKPLDTRLVYSYSLCTMAYGIEQLVEVEASLSLGVMSPCRIMSSLLFFVVVPLEFF